MRLQRNSFLIGFFLVIATAANLSADLRGEVSRSDNRGSKEQIEEIYRYLNEQFLNQNEIAAHEALQQLRQSLEQHQQVILQTRRALERFARETGQDDRGQMMTDQLARLEQTLRYQYLLQMLWLDPENEPGRGENDFSLPGTERKEQVFGDGVKPPLGPEKSQP